MPKKILDDMSTIKKIDKAGMLKMIAEFPQMMEAGAKLGEKLELKLNGKISSVIVAGMGASGIGGDILATALQERVDFPIYVNRNYTISKSVKDVLFFAVSYSGNTEETLAALKEAEAKALKIVCITSGGRLKEEAEAKGYPLVLVPSGIQPRAALGFLFTPILIILENSGLIEGLKIEVERTVKLLCDLRKGYAEDTPQKLNSAKKLAASLKGSVPIIYGTSSVTDAAALRWRTQLNENSKMIAFTNLFPELDHNEIVGISALKAQKNNFSVVILRDASETSRMKKRIEATKAIIKKALKSMTEVWGEGQSRLERLISLIYFGDYLSAYLAILNKVDPTPVTAIEKLKKKLAEQSL